VDFSAYLQSVIANYDKQRDLYTLTDLQVEYREEKGRSPDGSERQPEKKVERLEVLTGLRKYVQKGQVLLVGKPGSGKSTALERLRWELAQAALADEQQPIPMLVALRGLRHNFGILETIAFELQKGDPSLVLESKDIQQLLLKGRLFLLLDGVNEVPSDDLYSDVELFRGNLSNAPMIFTSRELGVRLGIEQKLEMCRLTERQMQSFVQNYLPDYAEVLLRQLKDRLRELAETPLLLKLLCDVFDPVTQQLPQSKGELFRVMDAKFNNWKQHEGVRTAEKFWQWNSDILRYLAFVMLQADDTPKGEWLQIERTHAEHLLEEFLQDRVTAPGEKARDWLQDLLEHHLLQVTANPKQIEFCHQLFQEYYAAEYLAHKIQQCPEWLHKIPSQPYALFQREYLNLLKWTETLAMTTALITSETLAVQVVKLSLEVDWWLGARLAGQTNPIFHKQTIALIKTLELPRNIETKLLGITGSDEIVNLLCKELTDEDAGIRWIIVDALGNVKNEAAVLLLMKVLKDADTRIRFKAVSELGRSNSETAVKALIRVIKNGNSSDDELSYTCLEAVEALGDIGSESAVTFLLELLGDNYPSRIRSKALLELRELGIKIPVDKILQLLDDDDIAVRLNTASEIQYMNNFVEILTVAQKRGIDLPPVPTPDKYNSLFSDEVASLVNQFRNTDITPLINDLNNEDWEVCCRAAEALGEIRDESAVLALTEVLYDENRSIAWICAADALAKINTQRSVRALLYCLKNDNSDLRQYVINALGETRRQALAKIVALVLQSDEDMFVRLSAAVALGKIGGELAVEALREQVIFDEEAAVGDIAAKELGKLARVEDLSYIRELISLDHNTAFFETIKMIQFRCQFYNYGIFCSDPESPQPTFIDLHTKIDKIDQRTKQMAEQPSISIGTISGGIQNFTPNQGTQTNTNIDTQNNYFGADDDLKRQTADLHQFIAELEAKHPQVQTETAANEVVDVEIIAVQTNDRSRWQILHQKMLLLKRQLFNPDRHLQAAKATLVEVTKAAYEKSLIAKAIITYIDKLSEEPNHGV
jgi:HEAT repeat protein